MTAHWNDPLSKLIRDAERDKIDVLATIEGFEEVGEDLQVRPWLYGETIARFMSIGIDLEAMIEDAMLKKETIEFKFDKRDAANEGEFVFRERAAQTDNSQSTPALPLDRPRTATVKIGESVADVCFSPYIHGFVQVDISVRAPTTLNVDRDMSICHLPSGKEVAITLEAGEAAALSGRGFLEIAWQDLNIDDQFSIEAQGA